MINQNDLSLKIFASYLEKNFKKNTKILLSISCGLDSTVLLKLINESNFFKKKNISISTAIVNLIVNKCNGDREILLNELIKIEHFSKNGKKVTHEIIAKLTNLI